ncbi:MAG TPA: class I SAM-dependent methyltransferase [Verrucomicrobiae bacterium]|nr:class I SAM-dependent methyltransferase [Verrucomicrobiae bacterium]
MKHKHIHKSEERRIAAAHVVPPPARLIPRIPRIQELCRGKRVLDVGCCNHSNFEHLEEGGFLHAEIAKVAAAVVGFDNDIESIKEMVAHGFKVIEGNAENIPAANLGEFDVIVAGELIEHLSNAGLFLDSAHASLKPGGLLVSTVPNAWAFSRIKQLYKGLDDTLWTHPQHTCWYSRATALELFQRHGFKVIELGFCDMRTSNQLLKRVRDWLRLGWARKPEFAESVFVVGQKPGGRELINV